MNRDTIKMKLILHFPLQILLQTFFSPMNIQRVTLEVPTETRVVVHMKSPVLLTDFDQN
jgi:hypothetical protein